MAYLSFWAIRKRKRRNTRQYSPNRPMKLFQTLQKQSILTQKERHYQIKRWKTIRLCLSCCLSFPTTWSFRLQMCIFATSIRCSSSLCSYVAAKRLQRVSAALACSYASFRLDCVEKDQEKLHCDDSTVIHKSFAIHDFNVYFDSSTNRSLSLKENMSFIFFPPPGSLHQASLTQSYSDAFLSYLLSNFSLSAEFACDLRRVEDRWGDLRSSWLP